VEKDPRFRLRLGTPAQVASWFDQGECDVMLCSSIEAFRSNRKVIGGFGVCSYGAVRSVMVLGKVQKGQAQTLLLDEASHTSNALAKVVLEHLYQVKVEEPGGLQPDLEVVIGDRALALQPVEQPHLDLGSEWSKLTLAMGERFPFVYAVWIVRSGVDPGFIQAAVEQGLADSGCVDEAIERFPQFEPAIIRSYLEQALHYSWDQKGRGGQHWRSLLAFYDLVSRSMPTLAPSLAPPTLVGGNGDDPSPLQGLD
jgi:chorismate dehydratase